MDPLELYAIDKTTPATALVALRRPPGVRDVPASAIVGAVELRHTEPAWETLTLMKAFDELHRSYMRGERALKPSLLRAARVRPGEHVYVIDGRVPDPGGEVPFREIIGWYQSDAEGRPIAATFEYNEEHAPIEHGAPSSIFSDPALCELAFGAPPA